MKEKPVFRVITHPVQDYSDKSTLNLLVKALSGKSLQEFVHDVRINKDGQYDDLFVTEEPKKEEKAL